MRFKAHSYQIEAAKFMLYNPYSALFADPGLGKTAMVLMVLHRLKQTGTLHTPVLVTSTLSIATQVWSGEIEKWDQFGHFTHTILHGKEKDQRLKKDTDLHIINNEGLPWLSKHKDFDRYKVLIIDESSKFKNWSAQRTKIIRYRIKQFTRRHILTGSPAPRSLLDLFAQMFLCDGGRTLGIYKTPFKLKYFVDCGNPSGYSDWQPRKGSKDLIYKKIAPSCYRLDMKDRLKIPPLTINDVKIDLGTELTQLSLDTLKKLDLTIPLSSSSESVQSRRIAGGVLEDGRMVHDKKLNALRNIVDELQGSPVIVFFHFRAEGEMLQDNFNAPIIYGRTSPTKAKTIVKKWNAGEIPVLLCNPASTGHGLNMQEGGHHVVWYSFPYDQDPYYQGIRRVWRQGVKHSVIMHRLIAEKTIDVAMVKSLESKTNQQQALLDAIKELTK